MTLGLSYSTFASKRKRKPMNEVELKHQFDRAADYMEALAIGYKTIALGYDALAFQMATKLLTEMAEDPEPEKFTGKGRNHRSSVRRYYFKPGKKTVLIDEFYAIAKSKAENDKGEKD